MPLIAFSRLSIVITAVLFLAACTRGQSNYGLNASQLAGAGDGAGDSGPIVPGTVREFSARVGDTVYFSTDNTPAQPRGAADPDRPGAMAEPLSAIPHRHRGARGRARHAGI